MSFLSSSIANSSFSPLYSKSFSLFLLNYKCLYKSLLLFQLLFSPNWRTMVEQKPVSFARREYIKLMPKHWILSLVHVFHLLSLFHSQLKFIVDTRWTHLQCKNLPLFNRWLAWVRKRGRVIESESGKVSSELGCG